MGWDARVMLPGITSKLILRLPGYLPGAGDEQADGGDGQCARFGNHRFAVNHRGFFAASTAEMLLGPIKDVFYIQRDHSRLIGSRFELQRCNAPATLLPCG